MKYAIVTRADNKVKQVSDITHPIIKQFAKKWNCDFIVLNHKPDYYLPQPRQIYDTDGFIHYRILKLYDLLDNYDRILSIDTDILITPKCPNPFEIVAEDKIGSVLEDKGSREMDRLLLMMQIQSKYGYVGWENSYINTGFFIVSKQHKEIFQTINGEYWSTTGLDDVHLGYLIHKLQFSIQELSFKFNHMSMFSEEWNNSPNRFKSFCIHYAGSGIFDTNASSKYEQLILDYRKLYT